MQQVRAIIVGVSRYAMQGWASPGAGRNAARIAARLLQLGLPADRLHLFTTLDDAADEHRALLKAKGVVGRPTDFAEIDTFWRTELKQSAVPGDALFVFWSGHGMADQSSQRIFFCSDYESDLPGRVFNATLFTRHLRAAPLSHFHDQLIFADACGSYAKAKVAPASDAPISLQATRQLAIWASPEGAYAREQDGTGMFSLVVDRLLADASLDPWPAQNRLIEAMRALTAEWTHSPTHVRWYGNDGSDHDNLGTEDDRSKTTRALLDMLGNHAIPERVSTRAFANTARNLGLTGTRNATLPEAIAELADLDDEWNQGIPLGLVQFLQRILQDEELPDSVVPDLHRWIVTNSIAILRTRVDELLLAERQTMLLLIEIETDAVSGVLTGLSAHLRHPDLSPVPGFGTRRFPAHDQPSLEEAIRSLIETDAAEFSPGTIEVHLLLDPPAFGLSYQTMRLSVGDPIGDHHICIGHYRRRAKAQTGPLVNDWLDWVDALPEPVDTDLHELPPAPAVVPAARGIFYVERPLVTSPDPAFWRQLSRLLMLGAPYLCWPVVDSGDNTSFPVRLRTLMGDDKRFDEIPEHVRQRRLSGCPNAGAISILWDRPDFRPYDFQDLKGVG